MRSRASDSTDCKAADFKVPVEDLEGFVADWELDSQLRQYTRQTLYCRRDTLRKIFWFFGHRGIVEVGAPELKEFFLYCAQGHTEPGGRWGNPRMTTPMRPVTTHGYFRVLSALFHFLLEEDVIEHNPMARVRPPVVRSEAKQPVSNDHINALLGAAKCSQFSRRDTALLLVLLDSGIRAAELCGLQVKDVDLKGRTLQVLGKGNKVRTVYLGLAATKALILYLRGKKRSPEDPLFLNARHKAFGPSGIFQVMKRLAQEAGVPNLGPHAMRRTFAVNMLREGANVFSVQALMGHADLEMTRRYCAVAQTDMAEQHRRYSPADRLKSR